MPKKLDYPKSSFERSLKLAEAIDSLGGACSKDTAAEKLSLKADTGSFKTLIGSAAKYVLIKNQHGKLHISEHYKSIKLSYNEEERIMHLREAFFTPAIFKALYEQLKGNKLPMDILDKVLIKEYGVEEADASKVSKYFYDGLKIIRLLDEKDIILKIDALTLETPEVEVDQQDDKKNNLPTVPKEVIEEAYIITPDRYLVHFIGPGMNSKLEIQELDDLLIVEATLSKIKKKLIQNESN